MDVPTRVFRLIQLEGDWYWRLDIKNDDGLIGPFMSRGEATELSKEHLDPPRRDDRDPQQYRPIWPDVTGSIVWIQIVELGPQSHCTPARRGRSEP
jgi:hypothetical protein